MTRTYATRRPASGSLEVSTRSPLAVQACGSHPCAGRCAGHDTERELHRTSSGERAGTEVPAEVADVLSSPGDPLPSRTRSFLEPRFGHDFSGIRVHTDRRAAESAQAAGALAYTVGHHIVFGAGRFSPDTGSGRQLLAHELAHTIQQGSFRPGEVVRHLGADGDPSEVEAQQVARSVTGAPEESGDPSSTAPPQIARTARGSTPVVRRALTEDFRIRNISPEDAANPSMIFFELGSGTIPASELPKIAALATPPGQKLTLNGYSSEESSPAANDAVINKRLSAVEAALVAAGHTATRTRVNLRTSGIGQLDYRHTRSVEVLPTPVGLVAAPPVGVKACPAGAEVEPCGMAFLLSWPSANLAMILAGPKVNDPADAAANALIGTLFAGVPRPTVVTNFNLLWAQVATLPAQHRCRNTCQKGCGRPAFNEGRGVGVGPGRAMMTLCPDFLKSADRNWQARILIHESAHGIPGLAIDDIAYANTRQIRFLKPADAMRNTDSYVLLAWLLAHPGSVPIGPATPDVPVGMVPPEPDTAQRAVAWLESWLNYCQFDTELLYGTVSRSVPPAPAWDTSQPGDLFNIETMHHIAALFGLTDPGAAAPFVQPAVEERSKVAAIHDRYDQMYKAVNWQVLTITKGPAGSDAWGSHGATLPRLGQTVTVGPAFFGLAPTDGVKHLLLLMATAMSGISAPLRPKYVESADKIRQHRTLGP
jgi:hypothetical protein